MGYIDFIRQLSRMDNETLRDWLQSGIDPDLGKDHMENMLFQIELLNEAVKRVWDELEGHRDQCKRDSWLYDLEGTAEDFYAQHLTQVTQDTQVDKMIKKIEKGVKKLEKADKSRDKVCDYGSKMMKKKKKK